MDNWKTISGCHPSLWKMRRDFWCLQKGSWVYELLEALWIWKFSSSCMSALCTKSLLFVRNTTWRHLQEAFLQWWCCISLLYAIRMPVHSVWKQSVQYLPYYKTSLKFYFCSVVLVLDAEFLYTEYNMMHAYCALKTMAETIKERRKCSLMPN